MAFVTIRRAAAAAALAALCAVAQPNAVTAQGSVNPTASSVKEQQLLDALKPDQRLTGRVSIPDPGAANLIQPEGRLFRAERDQNARIGGLAILGVLGLLVLFYLVRGKVRMDGQGVFRHAVAKLAATVDEALAQNGLTPADVDWLVPHQANQRIIDAVAERLALPKEKIFVNLQKYGNTSAASCAIALTEAVRQGRIRKGDKVMLATFGSGLVWGAMVIEW